MVFFQLRYILLKILGGVTGCFREPQGSIWVLESSMGAQVEMAPVKIAPQYQSPNGLNVVKLVAKKETKTHLTDMLYYVYRYIRRPYEKATIKQHYPTHSNTRSWRGSDKQQVMHTNISQAAEQSRHAKDFPNSHIL